MAGIMQASTQHMPTKPRKAASTCIDCKSKNDTSEKLNSNIRTTVRLRKLCIAYVAHVVRNSLCKARCSRKYRGFRCEDLMKTCTFVNDPVSPVKHF